MIVVFFIFARLSSQIKLKVNLLISLTKYSGIVRTEVLYIGFDKPKVLTIFILPSKVSFLLFQQFNVFSRLWIFSLKFSLLAFSVLYEKCTPRAQIGSFGHLKFKRGFRLFSAKRSGSCADEDESDIVILIKERN